MNDVPPERAGEGDGEARPDGPAAGDAAPPSPSSSATSPVAASVAPAPPPVTRAEKLKRAGREAITTVLILVITFVTVKSLLIDVYLVRGGSMTPTFADGERVIVSRLTPRLFDLGRGDVVVFLRPRPARHLVKRVVAVPGDTVEMRDDRVFVNGKDVGPSHVGLGREGRKKLGAGFYWVLGDDRANSRDSRQFGPIPRHWIVGKVVGVIWPPSSIRLGSDD